ncbi:hypothetical protein BDZ45DRAFT_750991 [Acephala macrosclerotiorum]|nr:hypothetical protein BDZ45DRAFT_750991 [Acephala macrosclerotiorum]
MGDENIQAHDIAVLVSSNEEAGLLPEDGSVGERYSYGLDVGLASHPKKNVYQAWEPSGGSTTQVSNEDNSYIEREVSQMCEPRAGEASRAKAGGEASEISQTELIRVLLPSVKLIDQSLRRFIHSRRERKANNEGLIISAWRKENPVDSLCKGEYDELANSPKAMVGKRIKADNPKTDQRGDTFISERTEAVSMPMYKFKEIEHGLERKAGMPMTKFREEYPLESSSKGQYDNLEDMTMTWPMSMAMWYRTRKTFWGSCCM